MLPFFFGGGDSEKRSGKTISKYSIGGLNAAGIRNMVVSEHEFYIFIFF